MNNVHTYANLGGFFVTASQNASKQKWRLVMHAKNIIPSVNAQLEFQYSREMIPRTNENRK
jgi:hypothetical protein